MAKKAYNGDEKNIRSIRWEEIRRIVSAEKISTQQELLTRLNQMGYHVTQGTVSRDIRDMRLVKSSLPDGGYRYQVAPSVENNHISNQFYGLFQSAVIRVDSVLNQVVIRCYTGMANAICAAMDGLNWEGVLGTIAGDDTILVIADSRENAEALAKTLSEIRK